MLDPSNITLRQIDQFEKTAGASFSEVMDAISSLSDGKMPDASTMVNMALLASTFNGQPLTRDEVLDLSMNDVLAMLSDDEDTTDPE